MEFMFFQNSWTVMDARLCHLDEAHRRNKSHLIVNPKLPQLSGGHETSSPAEQGAIKSFFPSVSLSCWSFEVPDAAPEVWDCSFVYFCSSGRPCTSDAWTSERFDLVVQLELCCVEDFDWWEWVLFEVTLYSGLLHICQHDLLPFMFQREFCKHFPLTFISHAFPFAFWCTWGTAMVLHNFQVHNTQIWNTQYVFCGTVDCSDHKPRKAFDPIGTHGIKYRKDMYCLVQVHNMYRVA